MYDFIVMGIILSCTVGWFLLGVFLIVCADEEGWFVGLPYHILAVVLISMALFGPIIWAWFIIREWIGWR